MSWTVILPVKRLDRAKSRLRGALAGVGHESLVLAMVLDTLTAALASTKVSRVVVVTTDQMVATAARSVGADLILDVPDAGLNPALTHAAMLVRRRAAPMVAPAVAALPADLPALRTVELTAALSAAERIDAAAPETDPQPTPADSSSAQPAPAKPVRAIVADAAGTGTVLLAAAPGAALHPCFGAGSAAAHRRGGAVELTGRWPGLRRDVDTAADLADALVLGVGSRTGLATGTLAGSGAAEPTGAEPDTARWCWA